jgi:hypothetical protein
LSNGSCQCLITILSIFFLESCVGSVVGDTIETALIDLTSGAASFVYDTSILSAFVDRSFWLFVSAVTFSDESATVSGKEISRETSAFVKGAAGETGALG